MTQETPIQPVEPFRDRGGFMRDARRFRLVRDEDESGVSGTGVVAVGVEFPSGAVVFEWLNDENDDLRTDANGLSVKPGPNGVEDTREVHGHGGRTRVEWIDPSRAVREGDAVLCRGCGIEVPLSESVEKASGRVECPECGYPLRPAGGYHVGEQEGDPQPDGGHVLRDLELRSVSLVPEEDVEGFPGGVVRPVEDEEDPDV